MLSTPSQQLPSGTFIPRKERLREPRHLPGWSLVDSERLTWAQTQICVESGMLMESTTLFSLFFFFLSILKEYQKLFPDIPIGYSGHETGIAISVAAVALGAKVLERHITLDKTWKGSDHSASLEPGELAELVRSVRLVEKALGSPTKQLLPCEMACNEKVGSDPARCFCWEGLQWACLRGGL